MPLPALNALLVAYQTQISWLLAVAEEFENGQRKVTGKIGGKDVDISSDYAAEYRHRARNMRAIVDAYERLHAKEPDSQPVSGTVELGLQGSSSGPVTRNEERRGL